MVQMKDSGIEWTVQIPTDWRAEKLKFNAKIRQEKNDGSVLDSISLENIESFTASFVPTDSEYDVLNFLIAKKGDVLFGKLRPYLAKVYLCKHTICVGPGIAIFVPFKFESRFLKYMLLNPAFIDYINSFSHGTKMPMISTYSIKNSCLPIPTSNIQKTIANFLDSKIDQINLMIDNLNKQIESLKDYKKEIISETVTKGLDPNVPLKDSGIDWIGVIPKHWRRTTLLNILRCRISDGPHETPNYQDEGIPFISVDSLNDTEDIDFSIVKRYISEQDYENYSKKAKIEKGDILFSKAATIGKTAIVKNEKFMVWSPLAIIKTNHNICYNKYVYYLLNCPELIKNISNSGTYNTQVNVGMRSLEKAPIPLPPMNEQIDIANYLDMKCSQIDKLILLKHQTIDKLNEYSKSLIYEYVTGKKEVI